MRLLVIPYETKLAAASPFHCCFVSPGSKRTFLRVPRTMLTNSVSRISVMGSVMTITQVHILRGNRIDDGVSARLGV